MYPRTVVRTTLWTPDCCTYNTLDPQTVVRTTPGGSTVLRTAVIALLGFDFCRGLSFALSFALGFGLGLPLGFSFVLVLVFLWVFLLVFLLVLVLLKLLYV